MESGGLKSIRFAFLLTDTYSDQVSFKRLVLPEDSKNLILALVSSHLGAEERRFNDIIKGKGRGLVMVLHGAPGVGKTLTAECIAEFTRRPLYVISSGDLGKLQCRLPTTEGIDPRKKQVHQQQTWSGS